MNLKERIQEEKLQAERDAAEARRKLKNAKKRAEKRRKQKEKKARESIESATSTEQAASASEETQASIISKVPSDVKKQAQASLLEAVKSADIGNLQRLLEGGELDSSKGKPMPKELRLHRLSYLQYCIGILPLLHLCVSSPSAPNGKGDKAGKAAQAIFSGPSNTKLKMASHLLSLGNPQVDVDALDEEGRAVLHVAAMRGDADLISLLFASKGSAIDVHAKCRKHYWTALHYSSVGGHVQTCQLLLSYGASTEMKAGVDGAGATVLELLQQKLSSGANEAYIKSLEAVSALFSSRQAASAQASVLTDREDASRRPANKSSAPRTSNKVETAVKSQVSAGPAEDVGDASKASAKKKAKKKKTSTPSSPGDTTQSSATDASSRSVSDHLLENLLAMGFAEADAADALVRCNRNLDAAINYLCEKASEVESKPASPEKTAGGKGRSSAAPAKTPAKAGKAAQNAAAEENEARRKKELERKEEMRRINRAWNQQKATAIKEPAPASSTTQAESHPSGHSSSSNTTPSSPLVNSLGYGRPKTNGHDTLHQGSEFAPYSRRSSSLSGSSDLGPGSQAYGNEYSRAASPYVDVDVTGMAGSHQWQEYPPSLHSQDARLLDGGNGAGGHRHPYQHPVQSIQPRTRPQTGPVSVPFSHNRYQAAGQSVPYGRPGEYPSPSIAYNMYPMAPTSPQFDHFQQATTGAWDSGNHEVIDGAVELSAGARPFVPMYTASPQVPVGWVAGVTDGSPRESGLLSQLPTQSWGAPPDEQGGKSLMSAYPAALSGTAQGNSFHSLFAPSHGFLPGSSTGPAEYELHSLMSPVPAPLFDFASNGHVPDFGLHEGEHPDGHGDDLLHGVGALSIEQLISQFDDEDPVTAESN